MRAGTMSSRQDTRSVIKTAFAGRDALVDHGLREDTTFRCLCRDYRQCAAALEWWRSASHAAAPRRAREYADLLDELAVEIRSRLDHLQAHLPGAAGEGHGTQRPSPSFGLARRFRSAPVSDENATSAPSDSNPARRKP